MNKKDCRFTFRTFTEYQWVTHFACCIFTTSKVRKFLIISGRVEMPDQVGHDDGAENGFAQLPLPYRANSAMRTVSAGTERLVFSVMVSPVVTLRA